MTAISTLPPVRVDQVIPSLAVRDAIGVHTLALTEALRERGIESDIFYGDCTRDLLDRARPIGSSAGRPRIAGSCTRRPSAVPSSTPSPAGPNRSW